MGLGRPTKYKKFLLVCWLNTFQYLQLMKKRLFLPIKKGETYSKFETVANDIPTFEGFAESIKVDDKTLERWSKAKTPAGRPKFPEFCRAYSRAKQLQKEILIKIPLRVAIIPSSLCFMLRT